MNWAPLIQRWRAEADRREQHLAASAGAGMTLAALTHQRAVIETLRACAEQAEKSLKRQHKRLSREVVTVRVTKAPDGRDGPLR